MRREYRKLPAKKTPPDSGGVFFNKQGINQLLVLDSILIP